MKRKNYKRVLAGVTAAVLAATPVVAAADTFGGNPDAAAETAEADEESVSSEEEITTVVDAPVEADAAESLETITEAADPETAEEEIETEADSEEELAQAVVPLVANGTPVDKTGYSLKWEDNFEGSELDRTKWNVETHDPGWVNNELQSYVDSTDNIYLEDGHLVLKPIETVNEDGTKSYTSGRVNTQDKVTLKYGMVEARIKFPKGKGFLPAFWMMPNNEMLYGQWPRCGEIDGAEVLGNDTGTLYGTLHFGEPHKESQGTYTLEEGPDFSEVYHTFTIQWEPGRINWYCDGILYHSENDWYSSVEGQGTVAYPAPFDQPFYVILNLAVGGNWPGSPDETTDVNGSEMDVDYVKVYTKDDEAANDDNDVDAPEKDSTLKLADETGNLLTNGDFSDTTILKDGLNKTAWAFLTTGGGVGTGTVEDGQLVIRTENCGDLDYSIQVVQHGMPMERGGHYKLSFDAYADEARTMITDVSAPEMGWIRYLADTKLDLTTEKTHYEYDFVVNSKTDPAGRVEFNLGNQGSNATVYIDKVKLEKTGQDEIVESKTVLLDGNFVYNGSFQEGKNRMLYWDIAETNPEGTEVSATNTDNIRRLKIVAPEGTSEENPVVVSQSALALPDSGAYVVSYKAEGPEDGAIAVKVGDAVFAAVLEKDKEVVTEGKLEMTAEGSKDLVIEVTKPGTYYVDDVRVEEDSLIKNSSFAAGEAGWTPFADGSISSGVTHIVETQHEDAAFEMTIADTGSADWHVQLKQQPVVLEKGTTYKLSFRAKASTNRKIMYCFQRDGSQNKNEDGTEDWRPYCKQEKPELTTSWQTFTQTFEMTEDTDANSILCISMGAIDGQRITDKHDVYIDDVELVKVGSNILKNGDFSRGDEDWSMNVQGSAAGTMKAENGALVANIENVGTQDWEAQAIYTPFTLEQGKEYEVKYQASSTEKRPIKVVVMSTDGTWKYYGGGAIVIDEETKDYTFSFTMTNETDTKAGLYVSVGNVPDESGEGLGCPASTIVMDNFSVSEKIPEEPAEELPEGEDYAELIENGDFSNELDSWNASITAPAAGNLQVEDGKLVYDLTSVGDADWNAQAINLKHFLIEKGRVYEVKFKASSSVERLVKINIMSTDGNYKWYGGYDATLSPETKEYTFRFTMDGKKGNETDPESGFYISMGQTGNAPASRITLDDISLKRLPEDAEVTDAVITPVEDGTDKGQGEGQGEGKELTREEKVAAYVTSLYDAYLGRKPDKSGLKTWSEGLLNGTRTGADTVAGFVLSDEYQKNKVSDAEFVNALYKTVMGRNADKGGFNTWTGKLAEGATRKAVLAGFVNSTEFNKIMTDLGAKTGSYKSNDLLDKNPGVTAFAARLYTVCLNRPYDEKGLRTWTGLLLDKKMTGKDVANGFYNSKEFVGKGLSDEEFVENAYNTILGRKSDANGTKTWVGLLKSGKYTRNQMLDGFYYSKEFKELCASYGIQNA